MSPLLLYHYWRSSCSWRVRWALEYKGVPFEVRPINLLENEQNSPAYLKINPVGVVPALIYDRDHPPLCESWAILEWMEEVYPHHPLLPSTSSERARVRQLGLQIVTGIQPLQNLKVTKYHSDIPDERKRWVLHWIEKGFEVLEKSLKETEGKFAFGDQLTFVDLCLIPQVYNALRQEIDMNMFPTLKQIYERVILTPACQKAAPDRYQA